MTIPQEELDKLNGSNSDGLFDENIEKEEETGIFQEEEVKEENKEKVSESADEDSVADKARIPYSRFEKVNERAIRAEERLKILEEQAKSSQITPQSESITPNEWIELYGDSDASKRAWEIQEQLNARMREETTDKILEEIENRQTAKQREVEQNLEYIDDNLKQFEDKLGRELSEKEESAILDIQDEFTPKDEKGNYIAPLLSAEKAYEVYNLRQGNARAQNTQARKRVVSATSSSSDGEGSTSAFENYKPGVGGLWRNQL